ncbi:MAG: glycosyl transferase family 90 [Prevotella sp.]|jgi:hypothetical protein
MTQKQTFRNIYSTLNNGKNPKWKYYVQAYLNLYLPRSLQACLRKTTLRGWQQRSDADYIRKRVNYYCKLSADTPFDQNRFEKESVRLADQQITGQKVYYLDSFHYAKSFDKNLKWLLLPGDVTRVPECPSVTKSRPINGDNANSVIMKLNKVRHFIFVNDKIPFEKKQDRVIFRGKLNPRRKQFVEKYFNNPMFDVGGYKNSQPELSKKRLTVQEHLPFKFIMSLEGNDVASNLKWIMSSSSIAVMPRPVYETWFMEGKLIPNYHYIEVAPDFSNVEERVNYYVDHPREAKEIVHHANEYVAQFRNKKREDIISYLVLEKYFSFTNPSFHQI